MEITREMLIDDFAIRSFRDTGDQDYISARMSYRAELAYPAQWQSQQAIEKYLKCILLLHRVPATKVRHELSEALDLVNSCKSITLGLQEYSLEFLRHIDDYGKHRYLEVSYTTMDRSLHRLDCLVWELRRFCTLNLVPRSLILAKSKTVPRYELIGGVLEEIASSLKNPARKPLLWNNGFFGKRLKKRIKANSSWAAVNVPLYMHPEILDEVCQYVYVPNRELWRKHEAPFYEVPPDQ